MIKEVKTQVKVGVDLDVMWNALAKDVHIISQKVFPNLVEKVEILEGDGGLGTIYLFTFGPGTNCVKKMAYQKEKRVDFDGSQHLSSLEVVEGGHLSLGFSHYKTMLKLSPISRQETMIDATVSYESDILDEETMASRIASTMSANIKRIENYLLK